jgi:hypothetical protein
MASVWRSIGRGATARGQPRGAFPRAHARVAAGRRVPSSRPGPRPRRGHPAMTAALGIPSNADLVALARAKLATQLLRTAELDRLTGLLHHGERVVTLCHALCKSGRQEWRGLTVLTDERLICLYTGSSDAPPTEFAFRRSARSRRAPREVPGTRSAASSRCSCRAARLGWPVSARGSARRRSPSTSRPPSPRAPDSDRGRRQWPCEV